MSTRAALSAALQGYVDLAQAEESDVAPPLAPAQGREQAAASASSYSALSSALQGYIDLTREQSASYALLPPPDREQADARLSDALRQLPTAVAWSSGAEGAGDTPQGSSTVSYFVLQYSLYALQQRVERYTAQRARLASKSVEGDMVGLLTLSAEQRITFDELLQSAVSEVYAVTSGYARPLPIRGCIVNEGVPISVFSNSASGSFAKGSYIRITSSADSVGAIYLSLADGAQGSQVGNPAQWEVQPEYVDTSERVTLLLAEDRRIGVWGIQALEVIYRLIADQLYYHILAQWYAMCAMPDDAARAALSADDKRASLVIALDAARLEVEKESFF